jgi:putative SOS response-associated peptidase YedK
MCGRYTQKTSPTELAAMLGLAEVPVDLGQRYNIAPSQDILAIPNRGPRHAEVFRWGLVPAWATDPAIGNRLVNGRSETAAEKPAFRDALKYRRCLVIADGFFEWRRVGKDASPVYFQLQDGRPFVLAGLWESSHLHRKPEEPALHTACLLTTTANATVLPIHHRMPVLIAPEAMDTWLAPGPLDEATLRDLLQPRFGTEMIATEVSKYANDATHEGPECIQPARAVQGWLL